MNINDLLTLLNAGYTKNEIEAMTNSAPVSTPDPAPVSTPDPAPVSTPDPTSVPTPDPAPVSTPDPAPVSTWEDAEKRLAIMFNGFVKQLQDFARSNDESNGSAEKTVDDHLRDYLGGK